MSRRPPCGIGSSRRRFSSEQRRLRRSPPPGGLHRCGRGLVSFPYALAAAIAVLIVGFVSWNVLSDSDEGAIVRTASSNGINITLVYTPSDAAASISLDGLPAIGSDQTYQLWTIGPSALPVSAGLLERLDDGTAAQSLSGSFEGGTTFAITVEPGGGSEQPTTAPLIATEI